MVPDAPSGYRQLTGPALAGERDAPPPVTGDHRNTARPLRRCWRRAPRRLLLYQATPSLGTRPTKPFCRGDETVLKQGAEYSLLVRLGRPKCNLSSILFGRSRATDTSPQWASWRACSDRGFSSCSLGDQPRDLCCARAGCLSHWLSPTAQARTLSVAPLGE